MNHLTQHLFNIFLTFIKQHRVDFIDENIFQSSPSENVSVVKCVEQEIALEVSQIPINHITT